MINLNVYFLTDNAAPASNMVKYRVLYAFDARNPDELSVMPGDVVLVRSIFMKFKFIITFYFSYSQNLGIFR